LTNHYQGLARGPIDHQSSSVINSISKGAIEMGSVVKLDTATIVSSELLPRVSEAPSASTRGYGIAVGGDVDGIYSTTGDASGDDSTRATSGDGQGVVIVTQGRCLARVTNATAIVIGDPLSPSDTAGVLELADAVTDNIIAIALQVPTSTTDIIAVDVQREGLFT
jgi:hypothetical protein